jgi:hypothetical protein
LNTAQCPRYILYTLIFWNRTNSRNVVYMAYTSHNGQCQTNITSHNSSLKPMIPCEVLAQFGPHISKNANVFLYKLQISVHPFHSDLIYSMVRCSPLSIVNRLQAGRPWFDSRQEQPTIQLLPEALSPGIKRPGREVYHSNLVPRLRMHGAIPPLPHVVFMTWCLIKQRICLRGVEVT